MDNKTNGKGSELSRQPSKIVDPASLSKKLLAADQAKEDASNMYQQENNFNRQMDSSKPSGTPISTRDTSARQMEQAKTKDGNSNASNSTRQNFGRTVIQRNEHHRSGTTQANVGANNNKPTNNTIQNNIIQNNTNTKSNPQVSTPSRLHTASRTNVPPVSNESSKGGNFNARNEFTKRNLGESNQGARIPSPTYNAKNQANVNQTSSYTFNYNRGAFKGNKNFGGNENTVGGESGASCTPPVNRSTNIQPNHIESGNRLGSKESKGTRNGNVSNGNAISRGNVASASAITGTNLYSNAVRVSNMSQSEKLQGADKAKRDAQQMYQEEDRRRRMREAVEKSNLEKFEERLENHRSKNKISVDLNDVLPPRENRKVVSHYKSVRVEERPLSASKNDRMAPKTKEQHKQKEGAKTRQDVNAQASNKQANSNQGAKTGKIENTRQNTTIKTYKRTSYRMNQEEIKNIKDQIRGASKKSSKLTVKQALGKTMNTTKSVGKAGKTAVIDAASAMNSDYAAAEFTKKQANRVGTKIAKAAGVGGALSFAKGGVELLTSDDSAKAMTEVSTKIATKAIDKVIHVDRNLKKRAENEIKKKTKTVGKLDKQYDKLNSKELKLREKADKKYEKAKSKKNPKYKEKADKLTMKADKLRDKHAKANRKLGLKRNKETVRLNNLKAKARKKIARRKAAKKVALPLVAGAAIPLLLLIIIPSMLGGGASFGVYIIKHFVSNAITDFTDTIGGKNTALGEKLAELEKMNWSQFIADETAEHLGETFVKAAQKDSQSHYIDKKILLSTILEESGENGYPKYDWYCNLGEGSIGHVWMREQCDNVTDKDGKMIYDSNGTKGDKNYTEDLLYYPGGKISQMSKNYGYTTTLSYIDEKNRREIGIHENIMPIISMAHARYDDIWTWENYEVVEAYVWYMYTLSHNSAHYDDNADRDTGAYSYKIETPCNQDTLATEDYLEKFVYKGGVLKRPLSQKDENDKCSLPCSNIYYHGYTTDTILKDASVENQMKEKIKGTAKGVLSWIDTILGSNTADSIQMDGTFIITYNRDENGVYTNGLGVKSSKDGKEYNSPDEAGKSLGIVKDNNGNEHGCENLGYRKLYDKDNKYACGKNGHDHTKDCTYDKCGYSDEHQHTTEYGTTSQCTKCGKEHKHDDSCKLTCGYSPEYAHTHSQLCCKDKLIEHVHKDTCKIKKTVYDCNHRCGFECHRNGKCLHDSICTTKGCQSREEEVYNCGFKPEYKHEHTTGNCCSLDEHNHDTNLCGCKIEPHTCIPSKCCSITQHTHTADCCSTIAHTHKDWNGADDPGCYNTFAFCAGHCGGHIKPSVNIAVTYTMEGLAYQDAVALNAGTDKAKDSHWTGKSDFIKLKDNLANSKDLAEWTRNANKYCSRWFKAGPNGPISAVSYLTDSLDKAGLKIFRGWRDFWGKVGSDLVNKLFGEEAGSSPYYDIPSDQQLADLEKAPEGEDDQGFKGWFVGEGDKMSFNPDLFETLHSLYGDPSDFYALGVENWKSFDVVFNTGFNNRLSEEQVASISNVVKNTYYPNKNTQKVKNRMAIVEEALKASGMYSSLNDLDFATIIYTKAFVEEKGNAARDAISKAIKGQPANGVEKTVIDNLYPGDILIDTDTPMIAIYMGKYKDPILGSETHYVVDNTDGNSKTFIYRGCNRDEISRFFSFYKKVYKVSNK